MDFIAKNNFIVQYASADHFEADLATYKKVFPDSPIIPSLNRAEAYNKKQLDERMLLELLEAKGADIVLQGRNIAQPQQPKAIKEKPTAPALSAVEGKSQKPKAKSQKPKASPKKKAGHA